MKKNRMMRVASALLVAVLLTTCGISGTFAKYTTSASATDSARVAKWDIDFAGKSDTSKTFVFDLFDTVYEADGISTEDHVKTGTDETIIAPGTGGSFEIALGNASEVDAEYTISFKVNNANVPLEFKVGNGEWSEEISGQTGNLAMESGTASVTIYWRWAFTVDTNRDTSDTALGVTGTAAPSVTATVLVEQVD